MDICTIIAKNYVAQARVLARSFAEHHPGGRCFALVIDDYDGYIDPDDEPFAILTPAQIGCVEFDEMVLRYTVLELSTAVKPWLLAHLLSDGRPAITYLDPDIRIYSSLEHLDELAREHGVVLTPHNVEPLPDDGERPSQVDILLAGVYNLGYVSLGAREEIDTLLRWWRERLLNDCRVDPLNGYFVDQRWFDLAPGLVSDHAIVREPQYNLAYWNLHSHTLGHDGVRYTVDGVPLAFYHFSGFDPQRPDVLSRHQTRVRIGAGSALERICLQYTEELEAAGYAEAKGWPYTFDLLPSGIPYGALLRRLYVAAAQEGEVYGSPFTAAGEKQLLRWASSPAPGGPAGVSRVLAEVYRTRPDLQKAYTNLDEDPSGLLRWAEEGGAIEEPSLAMLASGPRADAPSRPEADGGDGGETEPQPVGAQELRRTPAWGANVVGYFRSELGTGEAARQLVSALDAAGVPLLPVHGRTIPPNRQGHGFTQLDYTAARFPVNVICINADMLGEFAAQAGKEFFDARYSIGMWFWEVEQFPARWASAFDHVDELWLATDHMVHAIGALSTVPITKITLPVEMAPVLPATRAELGLPEGFMFLFSFDYHSVFDRKNPLALVEAYKRAFGLDDGAVLVVKSINGAADPANHARLIAATEMREDVHVIDSYLSADHKNMMVAACDCYVSLHRAEGFGLTMAEAMYLDRPVIATGYSGNLDFMNERNSFLVDHRLVEIGPDAAPYPAAGRWAEPDVDDAARLMREVFEQPELAAERGRRGGQEIRRTHSAQAAGEVVRHRLDLLRERHEERLSKLAQTASSSGALEQMVAAGPPSHPRLRLGFPGRAARRLVLRVLRPYTAYQQTVNADLARSVGSVEARLQSLDLEASERHATVLAEARAEASRRGIWEHIAGLMRSMVGLETAFARLEPATAEIARSVQRMEWEGHALPYMSGEPFSEIAHPQVGLIQGYRGDPGTADDDAYRSFEDTFRGAEEFIRDRQRVYLDLIGDRAPVLDLGCGRGEFLDLLAERGIAYMGVDSDPGMVRRCHQKGHTGVVCADGLDYLDALEDGSIGAIFCAQVIEHLPYEVLLRLFRLARQKLSSDGIFIAETVNPHSPAALKAFWVDLTHQHPIFPEVALSLCRASGFSAAFVFHPNGIGDIERDRFVQGEYAVVAGGLGLLPPDTLGQPLTRSARDDSDAQAIVLGERVQPAVLPEPGN
ncbi:MAG: methyltransferase domain-containing protein [Solirubrobacteraceae bacterium]